MQLKVITLIRYVITAKSVGNEIKVEQGCVKKEGERKFIIRTFDYKNTSRLAVFRNEELGNCMKLINHT
jgi:hypothetical protein